VRVMLMVHSSGNQGLERREERQKGNWRGRQARPRQSPVGEMRVGGGN
jgi:hypothetical protein